MCHILQVLYLVNILPKSFYNQDVTIIKCGNKHGHSCTRKETFVGRDDFIIKANNNHSRH